MNGPSANSLVYPPRLPNDCLVALDQIVERLLVSRLLFPELFNPSLRGRRQSIRRWLLGLFLRIGKQIFSLYQSYRHLYHRNSEIRQFVEQAQCQRISLIAILEIRGQLTISDAKKSAITGRFCWTNRTKENIQDAGRFGWG